MGLQLDQGFLDFGLFGIAAVVRRLGEQGVDPLALGNLLGADGQGGQVTVGGHVVQRFLMQIVGIEKGLQAGELLGEGHRDTTSRRMRVDCRRAALPPLGKWRTVEPCG
ncbi:hypothetical protein D3C81_1695410 [compost metagenome]